MKPAKRAIKSTQPRMIAYNLFTKDATKTINFLDADVSVANDTITEVGHEHTTGDRVQLTSTGTLPAGLALATDYWVIVINADTIKLAASHANAYTGTEVTITAAAGGGTHTASLMDALGGPDSYIFRVEVVTTGLYRVFYKDLSRGNKVDMFKGLNDFIVQVSPITDETVPREKTKALSYVDIEVNTNSGTPNSPAVGRFNITLTGSQTTTRWS